MARARIAIGPAFGDFGGVSQHVRRLAEASRHKPELFRMPRASVYHPAWTRAFGFWESRALPPIDPATYALMRRLRARDVVHLHAYPVWITRALKARTSGPSVAFTVHQLVTDEDVAVRDRARWRRLMANLEEGCRRADAVVAVAAWMVPELASLGIVARHIPNGVDTARVREGDGARFARDHGIDLGEAVLFVGNDLPVKRPTLVLDVARENPDVPFVLIGRGLTAARLKSLSGRVLPENVRALGELPRAGVLDAYAAARAFILPSVRDSFPTALLEAMAAGVPVVAARSGGAAEIITDGENGFLAAPDDAEALARGVARALRAGPEIGRRAREHVVGTYDWRAVAQVIAFAWQLRQELSLSSGTVSAGSQ